MVYVDRRVRAQRLTATEIARRIDWPEWDFGNDILYDLCRKFPRHDRDEVIIAKVWLIGRSYSAAIERRTNQRVQSGEAFYEQVVAPAIRQSAIDEWFARIRNSRASEIDLTLEVHGRLTALFQRISGQQKRSLASKYLHFHFPKRFYLYDARARESLAKLVRLRGSTRLPRHADREYARFVHAVLALNEQIVVMSGRKLAPRELDKLLIRRP